MLVLPCRLVCLLLMSLVSGVAAAAEAPSAVASASAGAADRAFQVQTMTRIARPVLTALAAGRLAATIPKPAWADKRNAYVVLEAAGRTLGGLAPWLALGPDSTPEGALRGEFGDLARQAVVNLTDPASPDHGDFASPGQPLVDAAFLAYALLRAPRVLWAPLTPEQQARVISALQQTRATKPGQNNWLLFSATVEAALWEFTGQANLTVIDTAVNRHLEWYLGDGTYGDGPEFHWDYYNAYVIQPLLLESLYACQRHGHPLAAKLPLVLTRARRYAEVQERLISPEGTFPVIGRSSVYRFAAFHHLAYVALNHELPASLAPGAVRGALTAVIRRMTAAPGTFDDQGWLTPGAVGRQPAMRDTYNNVGSFYLCLEGFAPLGLAADEAFWTAPAAPWTQQRIWAGDDVANDHALHAPGR